MIRPGIAPVLDGTPWLDDLILADHRSKKSQERTLAVVVRLRRARYDVAVLLPNSFRSAWLAWLAGIPEHVGYLRYGRGLLLTDSLRPTYDAAGERLPVPIVESYLAEWQLLGCRGGTVRLELATTEAEEAAADRAWSKLGWASGRRASRLSEYQQSGWTCQELADRLVHGACATAGRRGRRGRARALRSGRTRGCPANREGGRVAGSRGRGRRASEPGTDQGLHATGRQSW